MKNIRLKHLINLVKNLQINRVKIAFEKLLDKNNIKDVNAS